MDVCRETSGGIPVGPPEEIAETAVYLSPAPQAEPQAAGFSSGLSPAPQAEPQAEAAASPFFCAQPNRLDSAMIVTSVFFI